MGGEEGEYFGGFGDALAEDFDFQVTEGGVELEGMVSRSSLTRFGGGVGDGLTVTDIALSGLEHLSTSVECDGKRLVGCVDVGVAASALW